MAKLEIVALYLILAGAAVYSYRRSGASPAAARLRLFIVTAAVIGLGALTVCTGGVLFS